MKRRAIAVGLTMVVGLGAGSALAGDGAKPMPQCPIMDEPANLAFRASTDEGPAFFCCDSCLAKYGKDPAKYAAKVAAQRQAMADRPAIQVTCPVTGEPVDGKTSVEQNGRKVSFCCKGCASKYEKDPGKYAAALANSYSYQTKCPVMGGEISPQAFTTIKTGQKIYFCCSACEKKFYDDPAKYASKLAAQGFVLKPEQLKPAEKQRSGDHHEAHEHGAHDHGDHGHDGHR